MADDLLDGVLHHQRVDKVVQGPLLLLRAGVLRVSFLVKSADVADADGVLVVNLPGSPGSIAMRPVHRERSANLNRPVKVDYIVIANHLEAALLVPLVYVSGTHVLALPCGGAMDYDRVNLICFHLSLLFCVSA